MIRAVLFDLDNTLIDFYRMKNEACLAACKAMKAGGLALPLEEAQSRLMNLYWKQGIEYEYIFQDFLRQELGKIDYRLLAKAVIAYRRTKAVYARPMPGVRPLLRVLSRRSLKIGVVTDAPAVRAWIRLVQMGLEDAFSPVVTFDDTGKTKPASEPFARALAALDIPPAHILFVGDKPEKDIAGAKAMGMKTAFARYGNPEFQGNSGADYDLERITDLLRHLE